MPAGQKVGQLLFAGGDWQIFDAGSDSLLLADPSLAEKWLEADFLDKALLHEVPFGAESFWGLTSPRRYHLRPVEGGERPKSKADALAFSSALRESRELSGEASFHDAIYLEQHSRLLPTWTLTPRVDDDMVLGTWITGGVMISSSSFRRLTSLTGRAPDDLSEIVQAAGLQVPPEAGLLAKRPVAPKAAEGAKAAGTQEGKEVSKEGGEGQMFRLPGRPQLEDFFNEHIVDIIHNAERYRAMGINFPSAVVLHGPPGCGKTFAVEKLVEFLDWPSFSMDSSTIGSPYIHGTSKKIAEVFDAAIDSAPSVIIIDEMESFLTDRSMSGMNQQHRVEEVAEFLRRIPEAVESQVLIFAMTNMIDRIDPAILRRGRFDHILEVGMPSKEEVASLVGSLLEKLPKADDLDTEKIVKGLVGRALSDSAFVIREAARLAAKEGKTQLDQESVDAALNSLPKEKKGGGIGFVQDK